MPSINEAAEAWIKDGTADTTPVTASTPDTTATETSAPADSTATEQQRDPVTGKFVATDTSTASATAVVPAAADATSTTTAAATPASAPSSETVAAAVEEFLEGRRGDQPFKIPKDVLLPWKRGKESGFAPITEVLASDMMERDYRIKTQQAAEDRRQLAIDKARLDAEQRVIADERENLRQAMLDPEKLEAYNAHYEQMQKNPVYKKMVEDALKQRVTEAELNIRLEVEQEEVNREAAQNLHDTIVEFGKQYPGVDPNRVRQLYAKGLVSGDIKEITEDSIHQVYKQEAGYTTQLLSPLQAELTALRAEIDTLKGSRAADAHNANTDKKLAQAKATPAVAATGNATAVGTSVPPPQFKPFTLSEYPSKISEWSKQV